MNFSILTSYFCGGEGGGMNFPDTKDKNTGQKFQVYLNPPFCQWVHSVDVMLWAGYRAMVRADKEVMI